MNLSVSDFLFAENVSSMRATSSNRKMLLKPVLIRRQKQHTHREPSERVLTLIGKLYEIEREADKKELSYTKRTELRREESVPILDAVKELLSNPGNPILPKNKLAEAVAYTLSHWQQLNPFS